MAYRIKSGQGETHGTFQTPEDVLRRLPPIKVDPSDNQEFALREGSLPPPRTGNTIETPFPASGAADKEPVVAGPLQVLRYSPEGAVPIAPELSVTFQRIKKKFQTRAGGCGVGFGFQRTVVGWRLQLQLCRTRYHPETFGRS